VKPVPAWRVLAITADPALATLPAVSRAIQTAGLDKLDLRHVAKLAVTPADAKHSRKIATA
jgi:hypothetical protein